ncbi:hypothetical protein ABIA44_000142 [Bradyrhizobium sp. USDA 329]
MGIGSQSAAATRYATQQHRPRLCSAPSKGRCPASGARELSIAPALSTSSLRGALAMKQSRLSLRKDSGLLPPSPKASADKSLRSQCRSKGRHRRSSNTHFKWQTRLRGLAAEFARALLRRSPSRAKRAQGRPGAGRHPRSAARNAHAGRTAQQHTGVANHSAFPARWSDGLCRALPGAEFVLASLTPAKFTGNRAG